MPDNDWQPSEDCLGDCKVLLRNAIHYLSDLERGRLLLRIALEQFEDASKADTLERVHALLLAYSEQSESTFDVLWDELKALSEVVRPDGLTKLPPGRMTFKDGSNLKIGRRS